MMAFSQLRIHLKSLAIGGLGPGKVTLTAIGIAQIMIGRGIMGIKL